MFNSFCSLWNVLCEAVSSSISTWKSVQDFDLSPESCSSGLWRWCIVPVGKLSRGLEPPVWAELLRRIFNWTRWLLFFYSWLLPESRVLYFLQAILLSLLLLLPLTSQIRRFTPHRLSCCWETLISHLIYFNLLWEDLHIGREGRGEHSNKNHRQDCFKTPASLMFWKKKFRQTPVTLNKTCLRWEGLFLSNMCFWRKSHWFER